MLRALRPSSSSSSSSIQVSATKDRDSRTERQAALLERFLRPMQLRKILQMQKRFWATPEIRTPLIFGHKLSLVAALKQAQLAVPTLLLRLLSPPH